MRGGQPLSAAVRAAASYPPRTCRLAVMLLVTALAILAPSRSSFADETLWDPLWKSAFQQQYVPGRSGIMLGAELEPGIYDLLVYDAAPGAIQATSVGTATIHGVWEVGWLGASSEPFGTVVDNTPVGGTAGATFTAISATISTFTGFTTPMAGLGANISLYIEANGQSADYSFATFAPIGAYSSVEKANAAALALAEPLPTNIPFVPVNPSDDSELACVARCHNQLLLDLQNAQNTLNHELGSCGWITGTIGGCATGCGVCLGLGGNLWGCGACCVGGGLLGGYLQYSDCTRSARARYDAAVENAKRAYRRCMAQCGIVIVEE